MAGTSPPHHYYAELKRRSDPPGQSSDSMLLYRKILGINTKCQDSGVTPLYTLAHLANAAGVPYRLLDQLLLNVDTNYRDFAVSKKKPPGMRRISAPSDLLAFVQGTILNRCVPANLVSEHAYAYIRGRGTRDVAQLHFGAKSLISLDIENFFGSCSSNQIFDIFLNAGYPRLLSLQLCALTTRGMGLRRVATTCEESSPRELYNFSKGYLPQGAPTSGMISNVLLAQFDVDANNLVNFYGGVYSRYSDDMQFSFPYRMGVSLVKEFIAEISKLLDPCGFRINRSKTRVQRNSDGLHLLGYSIFSDRISVNRRYKNKVLGLIYAIEKYGPSSVALKSSKLDEHAVLESLEGHFIYIKYADPPFGKSIESRVLSLLRRHGSTSI